jgi:formate dehydrogenase maturation protein FdhE
VDIKDQFALYEKTVKRLENLGISNPLAQIIYLAAEIEQYREIIHGLNEYIKRLQCGPTVEE